MIVVKVTGYESIWDATLGTPDAGTGIVEINGWIDVTQFWGYGEGNEGTPGPTLNVDGTNNWDFTNVPSDSTQVVNVDPPVWRDTAGGMRKWKPIQIFVNVVNIVYHGEAPFP